MADLYEVPPQDWSRAYWLTAIWTVAVLALSVVGFAWWRHLDGHPLKGLAPYTAAIFGEVSFLLVTLYAARSIRARAGSWQAALGLVRPTRRDVVPGLLWVLVQFAALIALGVLFGLVVPASTGHASSNLRGAHYHGVLSLVLALVAAVLVAPVVEEVQSRGLWLRAGMSRWGFARAALVSSALFGLLHAYQAGSVGGGVLLVVKLGLFGFLQCVLVRRTGRLGPAMVAHGAMNGLALWIALAT